MIWIQAVSAIFTTGCALFILSQCILTARDLRKVQPARERRFWLRWPRRHQKSPKVSASCCEHCANRRAALVPTAYDVCKTFQMLCDQSTSFRLTVERGGEAWFVYEDHRYTVRVIRTPVSSPLLRSALGR